MEKKALGIKLMFLLEVNRVKDKLNNGKYVAPHHYMNDTSEAERQELFISVWRRGTIVVTF